MSWKPEVKVGGEWSSNALRFRTEAEAKEYAFNLGMRWTLVEDWRAIWEEGDKVNHIYKEGKLEEENQE